MTNVYLDLKKEQPDDREFMALYDAAYEDDLDAFVRSSGVTIPHHAMGGADFTVSPSSFLR